VTGQNYLRQERLVEIIFATGRMQFKYLILKASFLLSFYCLETNSSEFVYKKNLFFLSALQFNCRHFLEAGNKKLGQRRSHDAWGLDQVLEISGTESGIRLSEEIVLQPDARVQVSDLQRYQYQIRFQDLSGKILDILIIDISFRLV